MRFGACLGLMASGMVGCERPVDDPYSDLVARPSDRMPTVLEAEFSTETPAMCHVEIGPESGEYRDRTAAETEARTAHRFLVAGFPVRDTSLWRVVCEAGGETVVGADQVFNAGAQPADLPSYSVSDVDLDTNAGGYRVLTALGTSGTVLVVNASGELVWWVRTTSGTVSLAAYPSADGLGIYWNLNDVERIEDVGVVEYRRWNLGDARTVVTPMGHHDFSVLPEGFAYIQADQREHLGEPAVGDNVIVMGPEGENPETLWSAWDALPIPDFAGCPHAFYLDACDWTHGNSLHYDPAGDRLVLSMHGEDAFASIPMDGGDPWYLGNAPYSDFSPRDADAVFSHQHGAKPWPGSTDTYLLFDNGVDELGRSRLLRVKTSEDGTYGVDWQYDADSRYRSIILGDADPVGDSGSVLASWGSEGLFTEVTEGGELVFSVSFDLGVTAGLVSWTPVLGGPL